jgi:hypothetical protein
MSSDDQRELAIFDEQAEARIRKVWHNGQMWYSIVDVIGLLTDSPSPRQYWGNLKTRMTSEGAQETLSKCEQLKMRAPDGKMRLTDAGESETILRIVESVPSPKAEPFKRWLARMGNERLQEMADPSLAADRMRREYARLGYPDAWINERLKNVVARDGVTAEWRERGAQEGRDFARLTDTLSRGTFDVTTAEHRQIKHISNRQNLRDSMTPVELALTSLAEVTSTELHQVRDAQGVKELERDAKEAGGIAGDARRAIEEALQRPVVSDVNYKQLRQGRRDELQPRLLETPDDGDEKA